MLVTNFKNDVFKWNMTTLQTDLLHQAAQDEGFAMASIDIQQNLL